MGIDSVGGVGFEVSKKEVEAIVGEFNYLDDMFDALLIDTDYTWAEVGDDINTRYVILIDDERYNDPELNVEALAEEVEKLKAWASFNRLEKKVKFIHQSYIY